MYRAISYQWASNASFNTVPNAWSPLESECCFFVSICSIYWGCFNKHVCVCVYECGCGVISLSWAISSTSCDKIHQLPLSSTPLDFIYLTQLKPARAAHQKYNQMQPIQIYSSCLTVKMLLHSDLRILECRANDVLNGLLEHVPWCSSTHPAILTSHGLLCGVTSPWEYVDLEASSKRALTFCFHPIEE